MYSDGVETYDETPGILSDNLLFRISLIDINGCKIETGASLNFQPGCLHAFCSHILQARSTLRKYNEDLLLHYAQMLEEHF